MRLTSAYKLQIRTQSADRDALLLLDGGELIAILVKLADISHGIRRGRWVVEATFGLERKRRSGTFASAADAADWVGVHVSSQPFVLGDDLVELR